MLCYARNRVPVFLTRIVAPFGIDLEVCPVRRDLRIEASTHHLLCRRQQGCAVIAVCARLYRTAARRRMPLFFRITFIIVRMGIQRGRKFVSSILPISPSTRLS